MKPFLRSSKIHQNILDTMKILYWYSYSLARDKAFWALNLLQLYTWTENELKLHYSDATASIGEARYGHIAFGIKAG